MNHFDVALAARAYRAGRALRISSYRHIRLLPQPLALVLWQLGAEPFSVAAMGWGSRRDALMTAVAGEPRNRDLEFALLLKFARWFNPLFEAPAADRKTAPQVVVPNSATVEMLGRLGRHLAYLPTSGPSPADPALVRLGRHLSFLWNHWTFPGQQIVVSLVDLLNKNWATPLSPLERQSLPALDAYLDPLAGEHGFYAARAEVNSVGPVPPGEEDERLEPLVSRFNKVRDGCTDPGVVSPLLGPVADHYRPLIHFAWNLLWRCRDREVEIPEAPSVARRWDKDREAYLLHMDWLARGGFRRTRQTARQAASTLRTLEEAKRLVEAEQACDDPLRILPDILANKAVRGRVIAVDRTHAERGKRSRMKRPLVTLLSPDPCLMPVGKKLSWSEQPAGREFLIHRIEPALDGVLVTLMLMTSSTTTGLPDVGNQACFSTHKTSTRWFAPLPRTDPWTHAPSCPPAVPASIDE